MLCYLQEVITQLMQLTDTLLQPHSTPTSQQNFQNDLLQQILAYMNKKVAEPMTVEEICHKFFISRSSLQSLFKDHLHTSPKHQAAKEQETDTGKPAHDQRDRLSARFQLHSLLFQTVQEVL